MKAQSLQEALGRDRYPGRGILVGTTPEGEAFFAYFIMGRSANSRNRVFEEREDGLYTLPFDASKVADPSLILYRAVGRCGECTVVTNGDQTDTILRALAQGGSFEDALRTRCFEPDAPNYTPRISAVLCGDGSYKMSILKSADAEGSACLRQFFEYPALPGVGHFLHTYAGDGDPLPSFAGEPEQVLIPDGAEATVETIWNALDVDNRISLCVCVGGKTYLKNKNGG